MMKLPWLIFNPEPVLYSQDKFRLALYIIVFAYYGVDLSSFQVILEEKK